MTKGNNETDIANEALHDKKKKKTNIIEANADANGKIHNKSFCNDFLPVQEIKLSFCLLLFSKF